MTMLALTTKKTFSALFVLWAIASTAFFVHAQDQNQEPQTSDSKTEEQQQVVTQQEVSQEDTTQKPAASQDESFIPSEEISEDLPVAFPVDI